MVVKVSGVNIKFSWILELNVKNLFNLFTYKYVQILKFEKGVY